MNYSLFALAIFICNISFAQYEDRVWLLGYGGGNQTPSNDSFGISILRFDNQNHFSIVNNQASNLNFDLCNSSISDTLGNLLIYSNGERLYNEDHQLIVNGGGLNSSDLYGAKMPQGALILPWPQKFDKFLLIVSEVKNFGLDVLAAGWKIYKNVISKINASGLYEITEKKIEIIQDTLEYGQITGIKHSNGRDWWILVPESYTNQYYTILLDSSGLSIVNTQSCGSAFIDGLGQAVFSPNGTKYVRANGVKTTTPTDLYIYDFDRCAGKLSNPIHLEYENWGFGTGCAISPNSRFLYAVNASYVFQYDLESTDISASKTLVAEWDGYVHEISFATTFSAAQLAPDGKIYIGTAFSTPFLHIIEYPDRKGVACQVRQRAIHLPNYNNYSIPNFPNFRLGSIDGSECDTLGFDNHPLCNWRWEREDTLAPLKVTFTDLSSYEPTEWHWDFGDGTVSQDTSPVHTYMDGGTYNVCLVVSNQYSADTFCQVVQLGISTTHNPILQSQIMVLPNPFQERLTVSSPQLDSGIFHLYDQMGRLVYEKPLAFGSTDIDTDTLPPGMYFWEVAGKAGRAKAGKIIKTAR